MEKQEAFSFHRSFWTPLNRPVHPETDLLSQYFLVFVIFPDFRRGRFTHCVLSAVRTGGGNDEIPERIAAGFTGADLKDAFFSHDASSSGRTQLICSSGSENSFDKGVDCQLELTRFYVES